MSFKKIIPVIVSFALLLSTINVNAGGYYRTSYYNNYQPTYYYDNNVRFIIVQVPTVDLATYDYFYTTGSARYDTTRVLVDAPPQPKPATHDDFNLIVGGQDENDAVSKDVKRILASNCLSCHKPGQAKNGVILFDKASNLFKYADKTQEKKRRQTILDSIKNGEMPKNGQPLVRADIEKLEQWVK